MQGNCADEFPEAFAAATPYLNRGPGQCLLLFGQDAQYNAQLAFLLGDSSTSVDMGAPPRVLAVLRVLEPLAPPATPAHACRCCPPPITDNTVP